MTTLPERLLAATKHVRLLREIREEDAFAGTVDWLAALDAAITAIEYESAQSLQAQEVVKETTINHARDPHCCGCYVIRWNDGDPVAVCGECGVQVALLDRLVSGAPEGGEWRTIAWAVETEHYGRGYSFSNEFIETFPNAPVSFGNLYLVAAPSPSAALQAGET